MSDTPRTDAICEAHISAHKDWFLSGCNALSSHGRLLERELAAAQARRLREIDRLDCTVREGGQTLHCPVDNQCLRCRFNSAQAKLAELEALLRRYRNEVPLGHQPHMIAHKVDEALKNG